MIVWLCGIYGFDLARECCIVISKLDWKNAFAAVSTFFSPLTFNSSPTSCQVPFQRCWAICIVCGAWIFPTISSPEPSPPGSPNSHSCRYDSPFYYFLLDWWWEKMLFIVGCQLSVSFCRSFCAFNYFHINNKFQTGAAVVWQPAEWCAARDCGPVDQPHQSATSEQLPAG